MAYNRDDDRKPSYPLGRFSGEGNMTEDPKDIGRDSTFVAFTVAFNSRNNKEYEGSFFVNVTCGSTTAERVLADGHKGKRVHVEGTLYKDEPWEKQNGDIVESYSLRADSVAESWRFPEKDGNSGSGSRRRRSDDEDEPRGRSGRTSRRSEEDEEEPRGRSGRSSRRGEDAEEEPRSERRSSRRSGGDDEEEPRGRSSRSSRRGEDEDEPRSERRSRRSSRSVEDKGDDVED